MFLLSDGPPRIRKNNILRIRENAFLLIYTLQNLQITLVVSQLLSITVTERSPTN